jgi:hypothetical protein
LNIEIVADDQHTEQSSNIDAMKRELVGVSTRGKTDDEVIEIYAEITGEVSLFKINII